MSPPVVTARNLCKSYRNGAVVTPVLQQVDFAVHRGECLFLAGPSGSGKTTLLSILGCILSPDSGELSILGEDVSRFTDVERARFRRERIGFAFQRFHLFESLSAEENVRVPFDLLGVSKSQSRGAARELLERVGLGSKAAAPVNRLSTGQRQRVAFARALAGDPELILADEPTASLDAEAGAEAMRLLKSLCHELERTVIIVTHDSRIFPLADRILTMSDGRLTGELTPSRPIQRRLSPVSPKLTSVDGFV